MNPGILNKRITLLELTDSENDYGEDVETYRGFYTTNANVKPLQGREFFQAQQVHSEITIKITIRYRKDLLILPNMKIQYGNRTLEIMSPPINVNEQNRYYEILCKELV